MSDRRDRMWGFFGAAVGVVVFVGLLAALALSVENGQSIRSPGEAKRLNAAAVTSDAGAEISPALQESSGSSLRVFECVRGGQRVFSDRSCGGDARIRDIDVTSMNTYHAPVSAFVESASSSPRTLQPSIAASTAPAEHRVECEALQRAKDAIDARMRRAYTSTEGEWLRGRRHRLEDQYWELRCLRGR